jgi:GNAT superfamily N-acetyltransferase
MSLSFRSAREDDYETYARLLVELAPGDPKLVPDREYWTERGVPATTFLEREGTVVAYGSIDAHGDEGYVRQLVVDPAHRRRGYGRAMMLELAATFRRAACTRWALDVIEGNASALALYESLGLRRAYPSTAYTFAWQDIDRLPTPGRPLETVVIDAAECPVIERAFELPTGTFTRSLPRKDVVLLRISDPARPDAVDLGIARFLRKPAMVLGLRVREPSFARTLLESARARADLASPTFEIIVAHDEALAAMLEGAGAQVKHRLQRLRGPLP